MPCLYKLIPFTRPMNMKPTQRSSPSLSTSGFQLGSISRSPSLLLGHLRRRVLRARLLDHFAQFPPELQELAELLCRGEGRIVHLLRCGWSHLSSARCGAFFNYDVEPRVSGHGDYDVFRGSVWHLHRVEPDRHVS